MEIFLISVTNLPTKTKESKNRKENGSSRRDPLRKSSDYALYGGFADVVLGTKVLVDTLLGHAVAP